MHQLQWISPNAPEQMPQKDKVKKTVIAIEYDTLRVFDGVQLQDTSGYK